MSIDQAAIRELLDTGEALADPARLQPGERGAFAAVVPAGHELVVQKYEVPGDRPKRRTGTTYVEDVASFAAYFLKHRKPTSEVYATFTESGGGTITGVLNASGGTDELADWQDHRVVLNLTQTPEWERWTGRNGRLMPQADFAEHIEAGLAQIRRPTGADMLQVAQSLSGTNNVTWESGTRLLDGTTQLTFREETTAQAKGGVEIPTDFDVLLRPWRATADAVLVTARFRYRIDRGNASLGYVLTDLDVHLEAAATNLLKELDAALNEDEGGPQIAVLRGTPAR